MNLLQKGCIRIYTLKAPHQPTGPKVMWAHGSFFGRRGANFVGSSKRWAIHSSRKNAANFIGTAFHTPANEVGCLRSGAVYQRGARTYFLGCSPKHSLGFLSDVKNQRRWLDSSRLRGSKALAGSGLLQETFEERYEIHFATETKPPFFELKDSTNEFSSRSTEREGKDFRFVSESLGFENFTPESHELGKELSGESKVSASGRKGRVSTFPSNPKKIWNDQFESVAFSGHFKSLKYSSQEGGTARHRLPLVHRNKSKKMDEGEISSQLPPAAGDVGSGDLPDELSGFGEGMSLAGYEIGSPSGMQRTKVEQTMKLAPPEDENFVFPHDDLKSSLLLRPFDMYPNERHFIGKTDNFSLKIASSAQIERVGTREKVETREGRPVLVRYGEVENSETVSYKDFKNPHPGGLYCSRIFGPMKNWVCTHPGCSDTKKGSGAAAVPVSRKGNDEFLGAPDGRGKYREFKCSVCGNALYPSSLRRYRMGYIHLYQPLVHVSYIHSRQNLFSHLLRWNTKEIHSLIYNNLNFINFGHSELLSACFAPLFGFCDDSLGEALEWLRGDYFALSDQATVVLRLLQPRETQIAERLSKAKTQIPERIFSQRPLRALGKQTAAGSSHQMRSHQSWLPTVQATWKKNWPPEPNPAAFSTAWKNSQNFPKKIESLLCPEIATVDTILLEDQNFFTDILSDWKKNFEVPKRKNLTLLEQFQLEIFEQEPSPFYGVFPETVEPVSDEFFESLSEPLSWVPAASERGHDTFGPLEGLGGSPQSTGQPIMLSAHEQTQNMDLLKVFFFPELEIFYQNTFGTFQSFLKDPERMYSTKFTQNSFFLIQDFLAKFQTQFFEKRIRQQPTNLPTAANEGGSFASQGKREQEPSRHGTMAQPGLPVLHWNPMKFESRNRSLDFICFRKDAMKKSFSRAEGFCISPMWKTGIASHMTGNHPSQTSGLKRLENARHHLQSLVSFFHRGASSEPHRPLAGALEKGGANSVGAAYEIGSRQVIGANADNEGRQSPGDVLERSLETAPFSSLQCSHLKANQLNFFGPKLKFKTMKKALRDAPLSGGDMTVKEVDRSPLGKLSSETFQTSSQRSLLTPGLFSGLRLKSSEREYRKFAIAGLQNFENRKQKSLQNFLGELQFGELQFTRPTTLSGQSKDMGKFVVGRRSPSVTAAGQAKQSRHQEHGVRSRILSRLVRVSKLYEVHVNAEKKLRKRKLTADNQVGSVASYHQRKFSGALQFTPFQSVLKISENRELLVKPYFVLSGIAQRMTRPKKQVPRSGLGFSLPLSHPAFAQNFVTSFNLSTKSKIKSILEHHLKKPSKIGRLSTDFLPPGNPLNSFKFFERSRIFERPDVVQEFEDFLGARNKALEKRISLQFLSQENQFHNFLAFIEFSPLYLKEQNHFVKKVHSLFFNPFFDGAISHFAAVQRKKSKKDRQQMKRLESRRVLGTAHLVGSNQERDTLPPRKSAPEGWPTSLAAGGRNQPMRPSGEPKVSFTEGSGATFGGSAVAHSSFSQNSWNFSPRGAIREGDLLYGWLPSEHMMQRLIKLLGNASLGTNSSEVMLSQKPFEILSLKKKKTRMYCFIVQKLLKGQDLHPLDKKIKSHLSLESLKVRGLRPSPVGATVVGSRKQSSSKAQKGLPEPFPTGFRPEGPASGGSFESQPLLRADQFDSTHLEKEGTRFALSSFHRQLQNLLFQKQSRHGFQEYHCEDGATILTDPQLAAPGSAAPTLAAAASAVGSNTALSSIGAFVAEPEYDLNFLFDLKSPDDFGPWKRWPEFAKFFLYNGGPTLKKYFRSENWPQTALRLRKRIRRADPSVVFTKKISKLFESPKYMGVSPEKWKTFLFTKVNRTKPGLMKEKITNYFREQRALLLAEEKRLKQEMREDSKDLGKESLYWLVFDEAEPERRFQFEDEREKEFRTYKKTYRQRQKAVEKVRAQKFKAQQKVEAQQRKEKEKQQKAFERAQLKLQKEKEKEQKQQERLLKRQQEKHKKMAGMPPTQVANKQPTKLAQGSLGTSSALNEAPVNEGDPAKSLPAGDGGGLKGSADDGEQPARFSFGDSSVQEATKPSGGPNLTVPTKLAPADQDSVPVPVDSVSVEAQSPTLLASQNSHVKKPKERSHHNSLTSEDSGSRDPGAHDDGSFEEKFFETDEELFEYFCQFKYPPYQKVMRRECISDEAFDFYNDFDSFGKSEQLAVLKAKRKKLRPNLVYIDSLNIQSAFEQFPFSPEDVGWSTASPLHFGNTLANPLWRNFLIHEMFKRNPLRDQKKLVKKDLVWEDFVTYQSYPLDINSLHRHLTTSATPRGCLSRMNALVDFDQQIKRYDLTTRKADKKKADQYYQRFQEYLKALQQPLKSARDEGASDGGSLVGNIQTNPQFSFKKRIRKISDKKRLVKQYRAVLTLLKNPSCIERGVFDKFPILPPDLRPILQLGDVKAVSDITSLYILLIQRNIRHGKILFESYGESNEFLIDSKTMVQVAADNALDKCREKNVNNLIVGRMLDYKDSATQIEQWASAKPKTKGPGAVTATLAPRTLYDRLSGKEGRFRMNLLGKRVDYSGRSVIIVGPSLQVDQCGLPYEMALELFQPFVLRYMLEDPDKKVQKYLQYDPWIPDDTLLDHLKLSAQLAEPISGTTVVGSSAPARHPDGKLSGPSQGSSPPAESHAANEGGPGPAGPAGQTNDSDAHEAISSSSPGQGKSDLELSEAKTPQGDHPESLETEGAVATGAVLTAITTHHVSAAPIRPIKSLSQAKLILRKKKALGRMILRQIVPRFPVLLNRAPTLHRLGIQGFHPVLVYGRALHLHPLVCGSFNADFDGDQMAVHIPLSLKARFDIRMLMFAPVNWLSPATGQPTVVPSQDMVLGLFYMTLEKIALQKGRGAFFNTLSDAVQAYQTGMLEIQSQIWVRWKGPFANNQMNDESSEEMYEDHSKQGKAHALRSEPQFHEDDFQFRRKPFFPENQSHFWKKMTKFNRPDSKTPAKSPGSSFQPSVSEKNLRVFQQPTKLAGTSTMGSPLVSPRVSPFGTAGEMTVRARWWNDFSTMRLVSHAFKRSQQKRSANRTAAYELGSGKERWFETARRQKRRRQSGPVKYIYQKGFFYHSFGRFSNDEDEPIEIRIHQTGKSRKIYPDFQWFEDSQEDSSSRISYIRTTPGRALMNQLIYPAYEEQEPTGSRWAFQNPETDTRTDSPSS